MQAVFLWLLLAVTTRLATGLQCITCTSDPETQPNPLCWGDGDGTISVNDTLEHGQQQDLLSVTENVPCSCCYLISGNLFLH